MQLPSWLAPWTVFYPMGSDYWNSSLIGVIPSPFVFVCSLVVSKENFQTKKNIASHLWDLLTF